MVTAPPLCSEPGFNGRRWPANLRRDPRVAVMVEEGYNYVQLVGRVHIIDDQAAAQQQMAKIAARYITKPELLAARLAEFAVCRIQPPLDDAHVVGDSRRTTRDLPRLV